MALNKKIQRRQDIIEAATQLFLQHGFDGTSLDMIIAETGGSRRTIYERFNNKEGLFIAAIEAMFERQIDNLEGLTIESVSIEETLVETGVAFVTGLTRSEPLALFRMLIGETNRFPKLSAQILEKGPERSYSIFSNYIEKQCTAGIMELSDIDLSARQLVEMMKGGLQIKALLCLENSPSNNEIRRNVEYAVKSFLKIALVKESTI